MFSLFMFLYPTEYNLRGLLTGPVENFDIPFSRWRIRTKLVSKNKKIKNKTLNFFF